MTEFDADEPIKPLVPRQKRFWNSDRFLGWSGIVLALSAAFFPWYVFYNEDKFGIYQTASKGAPVASNREGRIVFKEESTDLAERARKTIALAKPTDEIITGTVPAEKTEPEAGVEAMPEQPFPPEPQDFRLLHVFKGRAMIEDKTGVYLVRKGDMLPDFSKVAGFEERDGAWVILTDNGTVYDASGKRD